MENTISKETIQKVIAINTLGNDIKKEFAKLEQTISNRGPSSRNARQIDVFIEKHYKMMEDVEKQISVLGRYIELPSPLKKLIELEWILDMKLADHFFDYTKYLEKSRTHLRSGMKTQVRTYIRNIVDDLIMLDKWLSAFYLDKLRFKNPARLGTTSVPDLAG
jgi:hypothetical protein